jgi:hypothetical protein
VTAALEAVRSDIDPARIIGYRFMGARIYGTKSHKVRVDHGNGARYVDCGTLRQTMRMIENMIGARFSVDKYGVLRPAA